MHLIEQSEYYRLYWHDEDQTILIGEAYAGWTWSAAQIGFKKLNEIVEIRAQEKNVYVIIYLTTGAQLLPTDGSSLSHIRNLLRDDPDYEQLTIYVTRSNVIRTMLQLANRLNGIFQLANKLRFVSTMEHAFEIIEDHKTTNQPD